MPVLSRLDAVVQSLKLFPLGLMANAILRGEQRDVGLWHDMDQGFLLCIRRRMVSLSAEFISFPYKHRHRHEEGNHHNDPNISRCDEGLKTGSDQAAGNVDDEANQSNTDCDESGPPYRPSLVGWTGHDLKPQNNTDLHGRSRVHQIGLHHRC